MSFHRLKEHDRGAIFLINLHSSWRQSIVSDSVWHEALQAAHTAAATLPEQFDGDDLLRELSKRLLYERRATKYQLAGLEHPDPNIQLVAVRPLDDLEVMFERMLRHAEGADYAALESAMADGADADAMKRAAAVCTKLARSMSYLSVGRRWGIFWGTHKAHFDAFEGDVIAAGGDDDTVACAVRDWLGLVQYGPDDRNRPQHLFAFTAECDLADMNRHVIKARRPTTLDGFDNHRFRQDRPATATTLAGCGLTVDLARGIYTSGAPECVSTEISVAYFTCRYLGKLTTRADGDDSAFISYLSAGANLDDMATDLDRQVAP